MCSRDGAEFGVEGLEDLLGSNACLPLPMLAKSILCAAHAYGEQLDDQTLLLVRRDLIANSTRRFLDDKSLTHLTRGFAGKCCFRRLRTSYRLTGSC